MAVAVEAGMHVAAMERIKQKLSQHEGPSMGDWNAVLDEIRGRKFLPIDAVIGSTELRDFCAHEDAERARRTLTKSRNNEYHGRRIDEARLASECDEVLGALGTLLSKLDFFLDNPLVVVEKVRWDALTSTGVLSYRRLAGDHPIVPVREMSIDTPAIEAASAWGWRAVQSELGDGIS